MCVCVCVCVLGERGVSMCLCVSTFLPENLQYVTLNIKLFQNKTFIRPKKTLFSKTGQFT